MRRWNAFLVVAALVLTGFAACKYNPTVHPGTLECRDDHGCPSGYRCVGVTVERSGFCCNNPDPTLCTPPPQSPTDASGDSPADAPTIAGGDGGSSPELGSANDVSAERQAAEVSATDGAGTQSHDSSSPGLDAAGGSADTSGTIGTGGAGSVDAPVATGGVGGSDGPIGTGGARITDGPMPTDGPNAIDAPVTTGGTGGGGAAGAGGSGGASGTPVGTTNTGGTATGGAVTGGTSAGGAGGTSTGGTATGGAVTGGTSAGGAGGATGGVGATGGSCPGTMCGATCSDLYTDVNNCGACGRPCQNTNAHGMSCHGGACDTLDCIAGWGNCAQPAAPLADDGCETSVTTSSNCGGCGTKCALGQHCFGGLCICDASSCSAGCCKDKLCVAYDSQDETKCGTGGGDMRHLYRRDLR